MNKKTITIIIIGIVIIIGIFLWKRSSAPAPVSGGPNETNQEVSGEKVSFAQFVSKGGSYECTVNYNFQNNTTPATKSHVYVNNGAMSAQFTMAAGATTVNTSVVIKDGFMYTWTNLSPTGYKIASNADMNSANTWDFSRAGDYDCKPWTVQTSVFTLPTNVTFQTISQ